MIALIGGSGFVGTGLAKRLLDRHENFSIVDIVQSSVKDTLIADVRDTERLSACLENAKSIINLAAEHKDNVYPETLYTEVNVDGARNVCDAARKHNINTIIFTSTVAIYGLSSSCHRETDSPEPFNGYSRSKLNAEGIYMRWQKEDPDRRTLVIVRPSVIFGEENRGNVYNLFKQIASKVFVMVGNGQNKKSMAYVENVAAFLEYFLLSKVDPGIHIYNYADEPDLNMNALVDIVREQLHISEKLSLRLPYWLAYAAGLFFDGMAKLSSRTFAISSIRIKKFCSTTQVSCAHRKTLDFKPVVSIDDGIRRTIMFEFF